MVYPGLNLQGHGQPRPERTGEPYTIGYFARICPEKGLHKLVDAFCRLRQGPGARPARLHVSGSLGENNRAFFDEQKARLTGAGLLGDFTHIESPDLASKVRFLQSIDVLSVPTTYCEPKGLYILEALANGVPVVQPRHGSFPELVEATGGGVLVEPDDADELARCWGDCRTIRSSARSSASAASRRFSSGSTPGRWPRPPWQSSGNIAHDAVSHHAPRRVP